MPQAPGASQIKTLDDVRQHLVPVLVGAGILSYSHARCYHEAYGITSLVVSPHDLKTVSTSRFVDYRVVAHLDEETQLLTTLRSIGEELASQEKVGVLSGSDDWYVTTISLHKKELEHWFVVPYIDFSLLQDITRKEYFYTLCDELAIPYPQTWRLACGDPKTTLHAEQFSYPLIAKPSNSMKYQHVQFAGKKKIFEIETPQELERVWEAIHASEYDEELLIQDFIPGGDEGLRSLTLFADEHGEVRVSCSGRVVLQDHNPATIGNPVCIISERIESVIDDASRFLKRVGYHGWANFDVKYDPRDGSYRFFEINTRPGRNTYYVQLAGFNFVTAIVEDFVLGHEVPSTAAREPFLYTCVPSYVVKKSVSDTDVRRAALEMYRNGKANNPLFCAQDTLQQRFWAHVSYVHQIKKFKRYLWDTKGSQADVD